MPVEILEPGNSFCSRALLTKELIKKEIMLSNNLREPKITEKYELVANFTDKKKVKNRIISIKELDEQYGCLYPSQLSIVYNCN